MVAQVAISDLIINDRMTQLTRVLATLNAEFMQRSQGGEAILALARGLLAGQSCDVAAPQGITPEASSPIAAERRDDDLWSWRWTSC